MKKSERSVVKVRGVAQSCSRRIEGSGFVYATDRVMTNAHVVAGTKSTTVEVNGSQKKAIVVAYDPDRDLAVLYVKGLNAPVDALRRRRKAVETNADAIVIGYPLDGPYNAQSARIRDHRARSPVPTSTRTARSPGIYHDPGAGPQRQLRRPAGLP